MGSLPQHPMYHRVEADVERIHSLETVPPFDAEDTELAERVTRRVSGLPTPPGAPRLLPIQAAALDRIERERGGWVAVDVGGGKTVIGMCAPTVLGVAGSAVAFVPATLYDQTVSDYAVWSQVFGVLPPEIMTYESMSRANQQHYLRERRPRLLILDEAHKLKDPTTTRTKRFAAFIEEYRPMVVAMSGSFSPSGKVADYAHIARWALGDRSPVPLDDTHLLGLDTAIAPISRGGSFDTSEARAVWAAWDPPRDKDRQTDLRTAVRRRLHTAPGCVWSSVSSCSTPLIGTHWTHPLTDTTQAAVDGVKDEWTLPDGTELVSALEVGLQTNALPFGFFLTWDWDAVGGYDDPWNVARLGWSRAVRGYLQFRAVRGGPDSPLLIEQAVRTGGIDDPTVVAAYQAWQEQRHKEPPPPKVVWYDEEQGRTTAEALRAVEPGTLIWYQNPAMRQVLAWAGIPTRGAGQPAPNDPSTSWGVSIQSHATGWNLQMFRRNLILQPPGSPGTWQQLIGRTHRHGQRYPVTVSVCTTTEALEQRLQTALEGSKVVDAIHGSRWKLTEAFGGG